MVRFFCRAVWVILIFTVIAFLVWFAQDQIKRYFQFRTLTERTVTFFDIMPFPAITICSFNLIKNDSVVVTEERELLKVLHSQLVNKTMLLSSFDEHFLRNTSLNNLYRNGVMSPEEMFLQCFWESAPKDCVDFFHLRLTDHGYCYSFNEKRIGELFDLEFSTLVPGPDRGLEVFLWVGQDNYFIMNDHSAGFKVFIHNIYDEPDMTAAHILSPGFSHSISMNRHEYRFLPERGCVETIRKDVKTIDYDQDDCLLACRTQNVFRKCDCIGPFDRGDKTVCDPIQLVDCYRPAVLNVKPLAHECNCLTPCHRLTFDTKLSSAYLIENVVGNNSDPAWRENLVLLKVFFESKFLTLDDQVLAFTFEDLWASFGGYIGLATGCSILTLVELVELFVVRCVAYIKQLRDAERRDTVP